MKPRDSFGLDALLGRWPAQDPQEHGGKSWEERADAIVSSAVALEGQGSSEVVAALLAAPPLDAEPGEDAAASFQFLSEVPARPEAAAGAQRTMSSSDQQPKKPSLKELAARASQAGAGRSSVTPLPPSIRPTSDAPSAPATVTPISAKAKSQRASDPGREDSGVLRLADMQAQEAAKAEARAAEAEAALAAVAAKRAESQQAASAPVVAAPAPTSKGSSNGMWAGVAIAVIGIAAAFAVYRTQQKPAETPAPMAAVTETKPQQSAAPAPEAPKPQPTAEAPAAVASSEPAAPASAAPAANDDKGAGGSSGPASTAVASNDLKGTAPAASAKPGSKVGTLDEEMKKAVGANDLPSAPADESKPAAATGANLPDQPSQGNVSSAVRSVMPAARACVAGAPDATPASITFNSSGAATSVSVSGWAAANGKAGCVKSALQGARVSPFAKPSYTVPVTVRP